MAERLHGMQEVRGSTPLSSTPQDPSRLRGISAFQGSMERAMSRLSRLDTNRVTASALFDLPFGLRSTFEGWIRPAGGVERLPELVEEIGRYHRRSRRADDLFGAQFDTRGSGNHMYGDFAASPTNREPRTRSGVQLPSAPLSHRPAPVRGWAVVRGVVGCRWRRGGCARCGSRRGWVGGSIRLCGG